MYTQVTSLMLSPPPPSASFSELQNYRITELQIGRPIRFGHLLEIKRSK
jgi:hypothetical protein